VSAKGGVRCKRVQDPPRLGDGARYLVDRLWPRGVRKEGLAIDGWLRDAAPSHELRRWFGHDPRRWSEFQRRYAAELDARPEAWRPLLEAARRGRLTLLYAASDREHNNAVALARYLERRIGADRGARAGSAASRAEAAKRPRPPPAPRARRSPRESLGLRLAPRDLGAKLHPEVGDQACAKAVGKRAAPSKKRCRVSLYR
jgi:uncharacterized protein YeaO (DUF488 family)